jgi:hypothetical protein
MTYPERLSRAALKSNEVLGLVEALTKINSDSSLTYYSMPNYWEVADAALQAWDKK